MAIVSKTDRHGVDNAIEALQQSLFPRLIAYWDVNAVYTSYPRADKNYKEDDIIPEISLSLKENKEVLTEDQVGVNSFWLVNNSRPYDADNKQLVHDVSLIFQADLVKLYGQTNRADEEFNVDVLRELTRKNVFMFNEDITVITTVDAVYSDLTFSPEMKDKIIYTDISNLHVVRFDFEIRYNIDCIPTLAPICVPATYKNSDDSFIQSIDSATTFISPDIIVTIDNIPQPPSVTNVNLSFTTTPTTPITTSILTTGQENSHLAGDDGSRFLNGDYASVDIADITDHYNLVLNNEWGHKKRFTGKTGGYMDEVTGNFFDVNDVATTKALAFSDNILRDYAWRRQWYLLRSGARSWANAITLTLTESRGGETGWFCPNKAELESITSNNANAPSYIDNRLFNWSTTNVWSSTTDISDSARAHRMATGSDSWSIQAKTQSNPNSYIKIF